VSAQVVALSGGIGGAKLALGLYRILAPHSLTVIVNTGDDFEHLGLYICPDLDTTLYTLAGLANTELGWGRGDETWTFMRTLETLGGETWFRLGDADLALHVERTRRLKNGELLSEVTTQIARRLGIRAEIVPMSDEAVRTRVETSEGDLSFQDYFVRRRSEPAVRSIRYAGAAGARVAPGALAALKAEALEAIIVCPSNPYLSLDPLLAVPAMRAAVRTTGAPVIAVTPLVGGEAIKGPTAKIMDELGIERSPRAIARHYAGLIDALVIDRTDASLADSVGLPVHVTDTVMRTLEERERLAREVLAFAARLREGSRVRP
jgi:LPPG:FO 2-phospho-L-lactate transferase